MANFHLRDKSLSLKAVGLLSKMLSFNDGWKFSTKGLSAICKEGPDAILSALRELEKHGYLVRHRQRDGKGRMSSTIFEIYEEPQESTPERAIPHTENPCVEKPDVDNPRGDKSAQINTDQVITQERNTLSKNYQSINLDGMDRMDERSEYEEIIKENLDYDILCQDPKFDKDRFREIMDIMLDAVCSTAPTIRINGEDMPQQVVKSRFLKLNSSHIEYVLEAMNKNPSDIRNIRAYLLTALYTPFADAADDEAVTIPKDKYDLMIDDLLTMSEIIQCVADMRTQDVKAIREFGKFVPAFAAFEKNRLSLYREAAKEAEEIFDRWADEIDDFDEDYEPDEFFSD